MSLPNGRDLGGLPADGGRIRTGILFRSAAPTDAALVPELERLGITTVVDLRTEEESTTQPLALPPGTEVVRADLLADQPGSGAASLGAIAARALSGDTGVTAELPDLRRTMLASYRQFVELPSARHATQVALEAIAHGGGPVLIHCTAGKDRTGWLIALALAAVGVPRVAIEDDYLASGPVVQELFAPFRDRLAEQGVDPDLLAPALAVTPEYLATAYDAVTETAGSIAGYLADVRADVPALRQRLLTAPG